MVTSSIPHVRLGMLPEESGKKNISSGSFFDVIFASMFGVDILNSGLPFPIDPEISKFFPSDFYCEIKRIVF